MSDDYCATCQSYGNVHDPARHGVTGEVAPALHESVRYVTTGHGERVHVANAAASMTFCGRDVFSEFPGPVPLVHVCRRCAERILPLVLALGIGHD